MDKNKVLDKDKERRHSRYRKTATRHSSRNICINSRQNDTRKSVSRKIQNTSATPDSFHNQFLKSLNVENRSGAGDRFSPVVKRRASLPRLQVVPYSVRGNKETPTAVPCEDKGVQVQLRNHEVDVALAMAAGLGERCDLNNNSRCTVSLPLRVRTQTHASTQTKQQEHVDVEAQTLPPVQEGMSTQTTEEYLTMDEQQRLMKILLTMFIEKNQNGSTDTKQKEVLDFADLAVNYSELNKRIMRTCLSKEIAKSTPTPENNFANVSVEWKELVNWIDSAPAGVPKELKQNMRDSLMLKLKRPEALENSSVPTVLVDDNYIIPTESSTRTQVQTTSMGAEVKAASAAAATTVPSRFPPVRPLIAPSKMTPHTATKKPSEPDMKSMRIGQLLNMPVPPTPSPAVITAPPTMYPQARNYEQSPQLAAVAKQAKNIFITANDIAQLKKAKKNNVNTMQDRYLLRGGNTRSEWAQEVPDNISMPPPPPRPQPQPGRQTIIHQHSMAQRHHPYYANSSHVQINEQVEQVPPPRQMRNVQPQESLRRPATPCLRNGNHPQRQPNMYADCSLPVPGNNKQFEQMQQMPNYTSAYPNSQWDYYPQ